MHLFWKCELQIGCEQCMKTMRQCSLCVFIYISSDTCYVWIISVHSHVISMGKSCFLTLAVVAQDRNERVRIMYQLVESW